MSEQSEGAQSALVAPVSDPVQGDETPSTPAAQFRPDEHEAPDREAERKAAAAERSRRYRERRALLGGATKREAQKAAAQPSGANTIDADSNTATKPPTAAELADAERRVRAPLVGTIELLADGYSAATMPPGAPALGRDRAEKIAELWAPLIAPHVVSGGAWVGVALAAGGTAAAIKGWQYEVRDWRTARGQTQ